MRKKKVREPVSVHLDRLDPGTVSGLDAQGRRWAVRAGPLGATVRIQPGRKGSGRLLGLETPAPDSPIPPCPVFGTCGGCQLQDTPLSTQRDAKAELVSRLVAFPSHPAEGAPTGFGYRNKIELSFGTVRYASDAERAAGGGGERGDFLGFHPPGWFGRVVPIDACALASPAMNAIVSTLSAAGCSPAWDTRAHTGQWRHVVVREGEEGVLVTLVTTSHTPEVEVARVADLLAAQSAVTGVLWVTTDGVAEVATGTLRAVLHGSPSLRIRLGGAALTLPHDAFFQVNTAGAALLFRRVGDALFGPGGVGENGTLLDLYCGVGAIGLALAPRLPGTELLGVELNPAAIPLAQANAAAAGVSGAWHAGAVEEVLPTLSWTGPSWIVVDPPRVGLHPKAAQFLASLRAEVLVYVACNPGSLGRDRAVLEAGGWRMTDLWTVDLFPQTTHVEAVGRFVRA